MLISPYEKQEKQYMKNKNPFMIFLPGLSVGNFNAPNILYLHLHHPSPPLFCWECSLHKQ